MLTYADVCERRLSSKLSLYTHRERGERKIDSFFLFFSFVFLFFYYFFLTNASGARGSRMVRERAYPCCSVCCYHPSLSLPVPLPSIRQHTSAHVSTRQHTSAYVSIRQHTSAYVSIRNSHTQFRSLCTGALRA